MHQVRWVLLDQLEILELVVPLESPVYRDPMESLEHREHLVLKVNPDQRELLE